MKSFAHSACKKLLILKSLKEYQQKAFSRRYLLLTNVGISLSLSSAGDVLEQQYERYQGQQKYWDVERTMQMGASGVTVGVICHYWYLFLDKRLPGRSMQVVMKKILLDQVICSPLYITAFFVTAGFLKGEAGSEILNEIKAKAWRLYAAEWMVWPLAQFINFYWLPTKYRVFYDNVISLGYDVYTSQVKHTVSL